MQVIFFEILLFILLLVVSAFFSGAETAFFSLKKSHLKNKRQEDRILQLLSHPRRLLITILTGNTLVNTLMAFFAAIITTDIALRLNISLPILITLESIVLTIVILLVSEITPKILAIKNSEKFASRVSLPIKVAGFLLFPLASVLYHLTYFLTHWIPLKEESLFNSEDELRALADVGAEKGTLNEKEKRMIQSVFDYGETSVREIMVPRTDIVGIEQMSTIKSVINTIRKLPYSKFPVFDENLDNIKGILYAKDILPFLNGQESDYVIINICRKPYFVPESKQIDDLLKDFQSRRENIAIVVDEYGGTAGLVTVEDVVEEVVGEIKDEFDKESPLLVKIGSKKWVAEGKISLNDLQESLPISFPEIREYDTLGGFLLEQFGDIPKAKSKIDYDNYTFEVKSLSDNRIIKINITKLEGKSEPG